MPDNKQPFVFQDEEEVSKIYLKQLPQLKDTPVGWQEFGVPYEVNLYSLDSIERFKSHALKLVIGNHDAKKEIGFAIIEESAGADTTWSIQTFRRI